MINVNISQDKQAIKSYTWLHVDTFLDYCTIPNELLLEMYHLQIH